MKSERQERVIVNAAVSGAGRGGQGRWGGRGTEGSGVTLTRRGEG